MKVLVVGSNGQIGQHLIHFLKENKEHTVRAMVRKQEQANAYHNGTMFLMFWFLGKGIFHYFIK